MAAAVAVVALVLAGPAPAAGLAAGDADDRAAATLPGKVWAGEGDEDDGAAQ